MNQPTLEQLVAKGSLVRPSHPKAPEIWKVNWEGRIHLLKSYHHTKKTYQQTVGRLAISREWNALTRLSDRGVAPLPIWRLTPWSMTMEWVEGTSLEKLPNTPGLCDRLLAAAETLIRSLQQAGLAHADLGHDFWGTMGRESNLLWTPDERLVAIDFAGSLPTNRGPAAVKNLARALQLHDELLVTKVLYHFGDPRSEHPAWKYPSRRSLDWWNLMRVLGKI